MNDIEKQIKDEDFRLRVQEKILSLNKSEATEAEREEIKAKLAESRKKIIEMFRKKHEAEEEGKKL